MIVLFEGLDNTGKDTQINNLKSYLKNNQFHMFHYSAVKGLTAEECIEYSKKLYDEMFELCEYAIQNDKNFIFNRAHLGEMVYGKIYRNYEGDYIYDIEKNHKNILDKIYLIVFVDEPKGCIDRDDGLSFSTDINFKTYEKERFELAYTKSNIQNKILININKKDKNEVFEDIKKFLKV